MKEPVILRLEVEHMQTTMIRALQDQATDLNNAVKVACERFIKDGELQKQIDKAFMDAASGAIRSYFEYGEGRTALDEMVKKAFKRKMK